MKSIRQVSQQFPKFILWSQTQNKQVSGNENDFIVKSENEMFWKVVESRQSDNGKKKLSSSRDAAFESWAWT